MLHRKYVVWRGGYVGEPLAVCDNREDAEEVASLVFSLTPDSDHVKEVIYLRSKQSASVDALYNLCSCAMEYSPDDDEDDDADL